MVEESHPEWRDAFYVTTWKDPQAIRDPQYKPRGTRRHGPFRTYEDADSYGQLENCTHFSIEKARVAPNIHPPFLDKTGVRVQQTLMETLPYTE